MLCLTVYCWHFSGFEVNFPGNPGHGSRFIENTAVAKLVCVWVFDDVCSVCAYACVCLCINRHTSAHAVSVWCDSGVCADASVLQSCTCVCADASVLQSCTLACVQMHAGGSMFLPFPAQIHDGGPVLQGGSEDKVCMFVHRHLTCLASTVLYMFTIYTHSLIS